jgi:hypothetical protein
MPKSLRVLLPPVARRVHTGALVGDEKAARMSDAVAMKLIQMANGYRVSRLLFVVAELGLADLLAA